MMYEAFEDGGLWYVRNLKSGHLELVENKREAEGRAQLLNNMANNGSKDRRVAKDRRVHNKRISREYRLK